MTDAFDAVLLASFGGPEGPDEVVPFLERVTAGRGIPPERLLEVGQHYVQLGGVSPINAQNRSLVAALQAEVERRGGRVPIYLGNRNSTPFFADVLRQMHGDGHRRVLAIATSAYSSYSGCRQYREDLARGLAEAGLTDDMTVVKASPYGDLPGFPGAMLPGLLDALRDSVASGFEGLHVFFTTHSIPDTMAAASGPQLPGATEGRYLEQHLHVARELMADVQRELGATPEWSLVFQSRSGPPHVPWLEPDINDALTTAAQRGVRSVVLVPIGFISDHIEVIWDLDTQAKQTAEALGLDFARVPTAGVAESFVSGLVDIIDAALSGSSLGRDPLWSGLCAGECCANPRAQLPVVPGA